MIETIGSCPRLADGTQVPLSSAVRAGDFVFLSGQLGLDDQGRVVSDDIREQTRQCIDRLRAILLEAGGDLADVVKTSIWLTRAEDFPAVNQLWAEMFPERPPARSTVVSELLIPGARIEIDAIAFLDRESGDTAA